MKPRILLAAILILTFFVACSHGSGGDGPLLGQLSVKTDSEGNITEVQFNCERGDRLFEGTYTPVSLNFLHLGYCSDVVGVADIANCNGTINAECDGSKIQCVLEIADTECACQGDPDAQILLNETQVINLLITNAVTDIQQDKCALGEGVFICSC